MNSLPSTVLLALLLSAVPALASATPVLDLAPGETHAPAQAMTCPGIVLQKDEDDMPTTDVTRALRERYGSRQDSACRLNNQEGQRRLHITDGAHVEQLRTALNRLALDGAAFLEQDQQGQAPEPTLEQLQAAARMRGYRSADLPLIGMLVPEPSSYAMLLAGLALIGWRLRAGRRTA